MQMNGNAERLQKSFAELTELQLVLERAGGFFNDQQFRSRGTFEAGSASGVGLHGSLDCKRAGLPECDHTPACNCPMGDVRALSSLQLQAVQLCHTHLCQNPSALRSYAWTVVCLGLAPAEGPGVCLPAVRLGTACSVQLCRAVRAAVAPCRHQSPSTWALSSHEPPCIPVGCFSSPDKPTLCHSFGMLAFKRPCCRGDHGCAPAVGAGPGAQVCALGLCGRHDPAGEGEPPPVHSTLSSLSVPASVCCCWVWPCLQQQAQSWSMRGAGQWGDSWLLKLLSGSQHRVTGVIARKVDHLAPPALLSTQPAFADLPLSQHPRFCSCTSGCLVKLHP